MLRNGISWRARARLAGAIIAGGTLVAGGTAAASAAPARQAGAGGSPVVATAGGRVRGVAAGAADEFLGIPYAAPPVGPLRWRPPQPAARWPGVRDATQFAPHCPQPPSFFGVASMSEDCLYLNVFTPAGRPAPGWPPPGFRPSGHGVDSRRRAHHRRER